MYGRAGLTGWEGNNTAQPASSSHLAPRHFWGLQNGTHIRPRSPTPFNTIVIQKRIQSLIGYLSRAETPAGLWISAR